MKRKSEVSTVWNKLSEVSKTELAKADDIFKDVNAISTSFLNARNRLQNAGYDALNEYDKVEAKLKQQEKEIASFKSAAKDLGIDLPKQIVTAERYIQDLTTGLKRAKKIATQASKM